MSRAKQDRRLASTVERALGGVEIKVTAKATRRVHLRLQAEDCPGGDHAVDDVVG